MAGISFRLIVRNVCGTVVCLALLAGCEGKDSRDAPVVAPAYSFSVRASGYIYGPFSLVGIGLTQDGRRLVTCMLLNEYGTPELIGTWDAASGAGRGYFSENDFVVTLIISPDGSLVGGVEVNRRAVKIWNLKDAKTYSLITEPQRNERIIVAELIGRRRILLTKIVDSGGTPDHVAHIIEMWNVSPCSKVWSRTIPGTGTALAVSRDGKLIAVGGGRGAVCVFDDRGKSLENFKCGLLPIMSLCFSSNSKKIAVSSSSGRGWILSVLTGSIAATWAASDKPIGSLVYSPDGTEIAVARCEPESPELRDGDDGKLIADFQLVDPQTFDGSVPCLAFSPTGEKLYVGESSGIIGVYHVPKQAP